MNNILIENDNISFDNETVNVNIKSNKLTINIANNVTINDLDTNIDELNLTINIKANSSLTLNNYKNNSYINLNMQVNMEDNSNFYANIGYILIKPTVIKINTDMQGDNITNILNLRCLTKEQGCANIKVNGNVLKNTINNIMKEDIKILNQNHSENEICPNMLINTNEVKADHFATISGIDPKELFYLKTKGIKEQDGIKLLEKGFMKELFVNEIKI